MERTELIQRLEKSLDGAYYISQAAEKCAAAQSGIDQTYADAKEIQEKKSINVVVLFAVAIGVLFILCRFTPLGKGALFLLSLAISVAVAFWVVSQIAQYYDEQAEVYVKEHTAIYERELDIAKNELRSAARRDNARILQETVPQKYATVDAVSFFLDAVTNMRADSLKEAINLYETELHLREQTEMQSAQLAMLDESLNLSRQNLQLQGEMAQQQARLGKRVDKISRQVRFGNALDLINTFLK